MRAGLFFAAGTDDGAEDLALGAVTVSLQELDVAVDEDALTLLESVVGMISLLFLKVAPGVDGKFLPVAVQGIGEGTRPLADKRLARLARLPAHIRSRPGSSPGLQVGVMARLRARPGVHAGNLAGAVDLVGRALELVADEL